MCNSSWVDLVTKSLRVTKKTQWNSWSIVLATYTSILFALIYIDGIIVFYNQLGGCWFNSLVCHSINRYSLVIVETTHDTRIQSQLPNILKKFLIYLSSERKILNAWTYKWNIRLYIRNSGSPKSRNRYPDLKTLGLK